jgi:hypothetical protein
MFNLVAPGKKGNTLIIEKSAKAENPQTINVYIFPFLSRLPRIAGTGF